MTGFLQNAIFFIALLALSTVATAQNAYKCGSNYSQMPCPGGVLIDVADQRSPAQKMQADMGIVRDAQTADAMETARLKQEKIDLAANTPPARPAIETLIKKPADKKAKALKPPSFSKKKMATETQNKKNQKKTAPRKVADKP